MARVVYEPLQAKILHMILGGIHPLSSEFMGYSDSTDFREISPEHSRDDNEPKCDGKF